MSGRAGAASGRAGAASGPDECRGQWQDLGLVFRVQGQRRWMVSHGYVPTAVLQQDRIRVFAAFWDSERVGRLGYVDLDRTDPARVLGHSEHPVLELGGPGCFDAHGTTPMAAVEDGATLRLYYAGWQRLPGARYLLFTGLATSQDGGAHFTRHADVPVIDRSPGHHLVRTGFVRREGTRYRAWLAQSVGLVDVGGKPTPSYGLFHAESADGLHWPEAGTLCFAPEAASDGVFGYGRSAVWQDSSGYHAMLSVRRRTGYRIEYARSDDGVGWTRPGAAGYALSPGPGQTETMFPSVLQVDGTCLAFYNGDEFGREGIRCARWASG